MGGGYHFMKLEGRFLDSGSSSGYAVHLGRNASLVKVEIPASFEIRQGIHEIVLTMDINEWFTDPAVYSLVMDGSYTMNSQLLMKKISANGHDVLKFKLLK